MENIDMSMILLVNIITFLKMCLKLNMPVHTQHPKEKIS